MEVNFNRSGGRGIQCLSYLVKNRDATAYVHGLVVVYFRQLQATLYSIIMSIGLNTVTSHSEMCQSGQIISICEYHLIYL